jgi:hypothetical protein
MVSPLGVIAKQIAITNCAIRTHKGVEAFLAAIQEQARRKDYQDRDSMEQD